MSRDLRAESPHACVSFGAGSCGTWGNAHRPDFHNPAVRHCCARLGARSHPAHHVVECEWQMKCVKVEVRTRCLSLCVDTTHTRCVHPRNGAPCTLYAVRRAEVLALQLGLAAMRRRVPLAVNEDVEVGVPVDVLPREQLACDM